MRVSTFSLPLIFFVLLSSILLTTNSLAASPARVLIIHSYSVKGNPQWVADMNRGIKDQLGPSHQYFQYEMQTKIRPKVDHPRIAVNALRYFADIKPDIVFLTDDNALRLTGETIAKTGVPVIYMGINGDIRKDYSWLTGYKNVSGVLERPMLRRAIYDLDTLFTSKLHHVLILMGNNPSSQAIFETDLSGQSQFRINRINVTVFRGEWQQWQQRIEQLDSSTSAVVATTFLTMRDGKGKHISSMDIANWLTHHSPAPLFTIHKEFISDQYFVAGIVLSGYKMAREAAKIGQSMLDGIYTSTFDRSKYEYTEAVISRSQAEHWQLKVNDQRDPGQQIRYVD